jgi:hypothetical protein
LPLFFPLFTFDKQKRGVSRSAGSVLTFVHFPKNLSWPKQMARPLRLEFAGAVYDMTSRGDGREWLTTFCACFKI